NIQPSSALQGCIPFEHLLDKAPDNSFLCLFSCVCYVLLAPHEHTKLAAHSIECVFLGYSAEHKWYRCRDPVGRRLRFSRDVTFDESHPFYPRPSPGVSSTSLVQPLSFLAFLDTPITTTPFRSVSSTMSPSPVASSPEMPSSDEPSLVE